MILTIKKQFELIAYLERLERFADGLKTFPMLALFPLHLYFISTATKKNAMFRYTTNFLVIKEQFYFTFILIYFQKRLFIYF